MNKTIVPVTEFDTMTTGNHLQMIKALVPFLAPKEQKVIGIIIRIMELIDTIHFFEKSGKFNCGQPQNDLFSKDMINHMKKYCTAETQQFMDSILNMMNMTQVMNMFETKQNQPTDFSNLMGMFQSMNNPADALGSMLNKEQSDLYSQFMEKLDNEVY